MIDKNIILSNLPPYTNTKIVLVKNQSVKDIEKAIIENFYKYRSQYLNIAEIFVGATVEDTCKNIYDFLRKYVKNITEGEAVQTVKSPAAIVATGLTVGSDCKNYALFVAGVLDAINTLGIQKINFAFRFAKYYDLFGDVSNHVFIVVNDNGDDIWIDCINEVDCFNDKSRVPDKIKDVKIKNMLQSVSGYKTYGDGGDFSLSPGAMPGNALANLTPSNGGNFNPLSSGLDLLSSGGDLAIPGLGQAASIIKKYFPNAFSSAHTHSDLLQQIASGAITMSDKVQRFMAYCVQNVPVNSQIQPGQSDIWSIYLMVKEMFANWFGAANDAHLSQEWINTTFAGQLNKDTQAMWNIFMTKYVMPGASAEGHASEFQNYYIQPGANYSNDITAAGPASSIVNNTNKPGAASNSSSNGLLYVGGGLLLLKAMHIF
jgi:hypothetical protein